jgi:hypothetical protein
MPTPGITAEVFPLAPTGSRALGPLGFVGAYHRAIGVSSARQGGPSYPTTFEELAFGLEYRAVFGSDPRGLTIVPSIEWSETHFALGRATDGTVENELPNVDYSGPRIGAELVLPLFSSVAILADASFTKVVSAGDVISASYFRAGSVNTASGLFGLRVYLGDSFAIDVAGSIDHVFYAFNPMVGDKFIAGGALDDMYALRGSFRVAL